MCTPDGKQTAPSADSKGTVLCIDRYRSLLPTMKALLNSFGYKTLTASSVDEGLSHLSKNRTHIVILDYTLCCHDHHSNGCIADRIRAVQPYAKLILWCTDSSVTRDNPPCADAVFVKPVDPNKLVRQLNSLLGSNNAGT